LSDFTFYIRLRIRAFELSSMRNSMLQDASALFSLSEQLLLARGLSLTDSRCMDPAKLSFRLSSSEIRYIQNETHEPTRRVHRTAPSNAGQNRKLTKGENRVEELGQWQCPTLVSPPSDQRPPDMWERKPVSRRRARQGRWTIGCRSISDLRAEEGKKKATERRDVNLFRVSLRAPLTQRRVRGSCPCLCESWTLPSRTVANSRRVAKLRYGY